MALLTGTQVEGCRCNEDGERRARPRRVLLHRSGPLRRQRAFMPTPRRPRIAPLDRLLLPDPRSQHHRSDPIRP